LTEQSLFIVKPDAVARNLVGEVVSRFERKGFKLLKLKMFTFTQEQAENFYGVHKDN
jgi:nucleoside-diphosphate kinase